MEEVWRPVVGYEGLYEVSNMGKVKSLNYKRTSKEGILKPSDNGHGYLKVCLVKDGKAKWYKIHRLVASAFCENPMGYTEVNHLDEDKTNNCANNLEFCSSQYNCNYGTRNKRIAEKLSKPVLAIHKINGLILEFPSAQEASRQTGIANQNIIQCCKGKRKSCGGFYWMYANVDTTE